MASLRIVRRVMLMWLASSFLMCAGANATDIFSGVMSLASTDPTQLGRLSRNGVPSDWSVSPAVFPGVINPATPYHFTTLDLDLTALESAYGAYGGYIQISFDSTAATTFLSAYLDSYSPLDLSANYLGDPGQSGNNFGVDPLFFQVIVPANGHLILVLNESTTNGGLGLPGGVLVEAFLDNEFTDLPPPVPEPGTWALMAAGLALVGAVRRRQPKRLPA